MRENPYASLIGHFGRHYPGVWKALHLVLPLQNRNLNRLRRWDGSALSRRDRLLEPANAELLPNGPLEFAALDPCHQFSCLRIEIDDFHDGTDRGFRVEISVKRLTEPPPL